MIPPARFLIQLPFLSPLLSLAKASCIFNAGITLNLRFFIRNT